MNYVDLILVFVMILAVWGGWVRGFIMGSVDLLLLIGSLAAAIYFYPYGEEILSRYITEKSFLTRPLAFLSIIIIARLIMAVVFQSLLRQISSSAHKHAVNRFFGLIPGAINGLFYAAIISVLFLSVPVSDELTENTRTSKYAPKLALQVEWLEDKLSPVFNEAVSTSINKMTVAPESKTTIDLQFTVTDPSIRPDLEDKMLTLINAERMKRKLTALVADKALVPVARAHSTDMFARGYFSHQTPEGLSPADRVKKARIRYLVMGENLALGQTLAIAHRGLMNSPGHRANILNPAYGRVGIGIVEGGVHGLMITQEFRN